MDNENNPMLKFDAFTYGIEDGGLRSTDAIKFMVCYIIANSNVKITTDTIVKTMVEGNIANYFEVSDAISFLQKHNNIIQDEKGFLSLTESSKNATEIVEKDLPITLRKKSIELSRKIVNKEIFSKENKVEIEKSDNGFYITLNVSDGNTDFMNLKLFVSTETQAQVIKESFLDNPLEVYENLINSIFKDK